MPKSEMEERGTIVLNGDYICCYICDDCKKKE